MEEPGEESWPQYGIILGRRGLALAALECPGRHGSWPRQRYPHCVQVRVDFSMGNAGVIDGPEKPLAKL